MPVSPYEISMTTTQQRQGKETTCLQQNEYTREVSASCLPPPPQGLYEEPLQSKRWLLVQQQVVSCSPPGNLPREKMVLRGEKKASFSSKPLGDPPHVSTRKSGSKLRRLKPSDQTLKPQLPLLPNFLFQSYSIPQNIVSGFKQEKQ